MAWHGKLRDKLIEKINRAALRLAHTRGRLLQQVTQQKPAQHDQMTVFHVTHHKAGSQWVAEVLKHCAAPERLVLPQPRVAHFSPATLKQGGVFLTVYVSQPHFDAVTRAFPYPMRRFVVIRDLRDTLVSLYFSMRYSHRVEGPVGQMRPLLTKLSEEEGFLYLLGATGEGVAAQAGDEQANSEWASYNEADRRNHSPIARIADAQLSWMKADNRLLIHYEDLVADEYPAFQRIMDYCQIQVALEHLQMVIKYNSFEEKTGRKMGQEDIMAHHRKGIAGDWRNYFTERVTAEFKARYGSVLIATNYEKDLNW